MDETVGTQDRAKIAFDGAFVEKATRADDPSTTTDNINEFYVWAIIDKAEGLVFDDEKVWRSGDAWAYAETQYWTPGHTYYFSAIAGDRSNNQIDLDYAAAAGMDVAGLGTATFTNVDGTNDFLYAEHKATIAKPLAAAPEAVSFQFAHLLSKVKFTFENGFTNKNSTIVIKNVEFAAPKTGEIDLTQDALAWAGQTGSVTLDMGHLALAAHVEAGKSAATDNERLTIPAPATTEYTVEFDVEHHMGGVLVSEDHKTVKISGVEFLPGRAYNFQATINQDNVDEQPLYEIVFKVAVDKWDEETTNGYHFDYASNAYRVESAEGLQSVAAGIESGAIDSNSNIILNGDIDLSALTRAAVANNWTPVGTEAKPYTGTFDGNGHTIKNLALVESEAKEGKAYIGFFGYAKDATIKNVTFENVYINIPCLDIDHSQGHIGAVAGSLEGTSTIENVTVKGDIKVYATQEANGASRVAVIAGGNSYGDVTMKNVHVIANEGSYLIANNNTGALAGQLQGKSVCENCTSNIDVTVNKFFAGGLIGLAAGDQLFVNCHTTGDVSVVAGRAGKAHDQYRVGGIAGGWADGKTKVCELINCSYTGTLTGKNADGSVTEVFDYLGYVGRGYTLNGCQGSKVIIDGLSFVQKYNTAAEAGIYDVTGANGETVVMISTVEELNKLTAKNVLVILAADLDFQGAAMTKPIELWGNSTFDGMGHKISNVKTAVQGGYATSLFRGDANTGNKVVKNLVVEGLTTPAGYSFAAAIWSDLQGANIEIDNVTINNATIEAAGTIGGFVGFVSASTTSVVIKNSSINNSELNGGEADHKRGAVVGRAYGCVVNCENVVVNNVQINGAAVTSSMLVGDKGYTGTVTVK